MIPAKVQRSSTEPRLKKDKPAWFTRLLSNTNSTFVVRLHQQPLILSTPTNRLSPHISKLNQSFIKRISRLFSFTIIPISLRACTDSYLTNAIGWAKSGQLFLLPHIMAISWMRDWLPHVHKPALVLINFVPEMPKQYWQAVFIVGAEKRTFDFPRIGLAVIRQASCWNNL